MKITHAQSQIVRLFEEVPQPVKGELAVPDKPGLGLKFDRDALKQYSA